MLQESIGYGCTGAPDRLVRTSENLRPSQPPPVPLGSVWVLQDQHQIVSDVGTVLVQCGPLGHQKASDMGPFLFDVASLEMQAVY